MPPQWMKPDPAEVNKLMLTDRLRDAVQDYMETDDANLHDAYSAISRIRSEVNEALGTQARLAGAPPFSDLNQAPATLGHFVALD